MWLVVAALAGLVGLVVIARRWAGAPAAEPAIPRSPSATASIGPHAVFDGGARYATEQERALAGVDATRLGEGLLMALVDALQARGVVVANPIEPEVHGFSTVVEIDGEDVSLRLAAGGLRDWQLLVISPSGIVPAEIRDALASLADLRNIDWR